MLLLLGLVVLIVTVVAATATAAETIVAVVGLHEAERELPFSGEKFCQVMLSRLTSNQKHRIPKIFLQISSQIK